MNEIHSRLLVALTSGVPDDPNLVFQMEDPQQREALFGVILRRLQTHTAASEIARLILVYSAAEKALDDQLKLAKGIDPAEAPEITKMLEDLQNDIGGLFQYSAEGPQRAYFEVPGFDGHIMRYVYKVIGVYADEPRIAVHALFSTVQQLAASIPDDKPRFVLWRRRPTLRQEFNEKEGKLIWVATIRIDVPFANWDAIKFVAHDGMDLQRV